MQCMKIKLFLVGIVSLFAFHQLAAEQLQDEIVAAVIIKEAGGEGNLGMQAVANVIHNRAKKSRQSHFAVVTRKHQFECIAPVVVRKKMTYSQFVSNAKAHPKFSYAFELVKKMKAGSLPDVTKGSTHFHNPSMTPYWAKVLPLRVTIGRHLFYQES